MNFSELVVCEKHYNAMTLEIPDLLWIKNWTWDIRNSFVW